VLLLAVVGATVRLPRTLSALSAPPAGAGGANRNAGSLKGLVAGARSTAVGCAERAILGALIDVTVVVVDRRLRKALARRPAEPASGRLLIAPPNDVCHQASSKADSDRPDPSRQP
jgi:hypothetical protein